MGGLRVLRVKRLLRIGGYGVRRSRMDGEEVRMGTGGHPEMGLGR